MGAMSGGLRHGRRDEGCAHLRPRYGGRGLETVQGPMHSLAVAVGILAPRAWFNEPPYRSTEEICPPSKY